jgi:ParB family chromosome partitioning protein
MATAPKDAGQLAVIILSISPDDVMVGERLGVFCPTKSAAIGRLMAEDGQNDPIKVCKAGPRAAKPWKLVVGHRRLEGARFEQLPRIYARNAAARYGGGGHRRWPQPE